MDPDVFLVDDPFQHLPIPSAQPEEPRANPHSLFSKNPKRTRTRKQVNENVIWFGILDT